MVKIIGKKIAVAIYIGFLTQYQPLYKISSKLDKNAEVEKSGYGSVLIGWSSQSKNGRSRFKLILCGSLPNISPQYKSDEKYKVENICDWSALVSWSVWSVKK